jgi:hypothetical protein
VNVKLQVPEGKKREEKVTGDSSKTHGTGAAARLSGTSFTSQTEYMCRNFG